MEAAWELSEAGVAREAWSGNVSERFDAMIKKTFEAFKGGVTPEELAVRSLFVLIQSVLLNSESQESILFSCLPQMFLLHLRRVART